MSSPAFVPPPLESYQGPADPLTGKPTGGQFVPPPLSSYRENPPVPGLTPGAPGSSSGLPHDWAQGGERVLSGMWDAATHPVTTASNIAKTIAGAGPVSGPPGSFQDEAAQTANAVKGFYGDRYGSPSKAAHTLVHDPIGTAADVAAVAAPLDPILAGGASVAEAANLPRVAGALRTGSDIANVAATYGNPLTDIIKGVTTPAGYAARNIASRLMKINSGLSPVEASAVDYAINNPNLSGTVDAATASGNKFLGSVKSLARKNPFTAGAVGTAENAQQADIAGEMGNLAYNVAPGGARTPLTAGISAWEKINRQLADYNSQSRAAYQKLFDAAEKNPQTVQVGTKQNPSLDPTAPATVPVMAKVNGPVSTAAVKQTASQLLEQLKKSIGEVQAQASPSGAVLQQIISRPDMVDIRTAIDDNSAIQNIARTETPALKTQAQRISAALVPAYRDAIDTAALQIGPDASRALQDGRQATINKYELGNALPRSLRVNQNPVRIAKALTAGDDVSIPMLQTIQKHVPQALPDVARATIEDIFSNSTDNGGISKIDSTINKWNKLGDQTKQILYGPDTTQEVTDLLQYAKMAISEPNKSGTAPVAQVMALFAALRNDPMSTLATMSGARQMTRLMFDPDVAASVRATGRVPASALKARMPGPVKVATTPVSADYANIGRVANANAPDQPK